MTWPWCALALALAVAAHAPCAQAEPMVRRFALVIGNNQPESDGDSVLAYADDDALTMHQLFVEAGVRSVLLAAPDESSRGSHPGTRVTGPPRLAELRSTVQELFLEMRSQREGGGRVEFFFFFSGHGGAGDGEGYIVLADARFSRSALAELLSQSPASTNHVFIDACRSFYMAFVQSKSNGAAQRAPYSGPLPFQQLPSTSSNTGFVLSTASERDSHEWARYRGGILSHELRSALRGAADVNLDGHISYLELDKFLEVANAGITNPNFRPDISVHAPGGNSAHDVLWHPLADAELRVIGGRIRHFYVEDENGVRLLDAHPEAGQAVMLWLPSARPIFVRANDGREEFQLLERRQITVERLSPAEPDVRSKGGGALGLALKQLFRIPFGLSSFGTVSAVPAAVVDEHDRVSTARTLALGVALGAAAAGLSFSAVALNVYLDRNEGDQIERAEHRGDFRRYALATIPCFAVAAGAGGVWAWLKFQPSVWLSTPASNGARGHPWGVQLRGAF